MSKTLKIAIVVQQCGVEVLAGAERYALNLGLALAKAGCEVKILTTQSADYKTWHNALSHKESIKVTKNIDPAYEHTTSELEILRFPNRSFRRPFLLRVAKLFWKIEQSLMPFQKKGLSEKLDQFFLWAQGPWCPGLWNYLEGNSTKFDLIVFKSYLYAPCALGMKASNERVTKVVIPAAHPEPSFYRPFVQSLFKSSSALGFVSLAEKRLVESIWQDTKLKEQLLIPPGLGNEWSIAPNGRNSFGDIRPHIKSLKNYFLVLGRMDRGKNLDFILQNTNPGITVVFAGPGELQVTNEKQFIRLGKVSEEEKAVLLENAIALIAVSKNEAFSMTTAEALAKGCPVIGWSQANAITELIDKFGGAKFTTPEEYRILLKKICSDPEFRQSARPDKEKIQQELSWQRSAQVLLNWFEQSLKKT